MDEEDVRRKIAGHQVGASLEALSVHELTALADELRQEVARVEAEIAKKADVRTAADSFFKL